MAEQVDHVGILAVSSYVPPGRLAIAELRRHWPGVGAPGGAKRVAVAGFDEDVVTLAVEAADAVLAATGRSGDDVDAVHVASCSAPYAEHSVAAEVARALDLPRSAATIDAGGSVRGGVTSLIAAVDSIKTGRARLVLVIAAERRRGAPGTAVEALGSGAVAMLVGVDAPVVVGASGSWRTGVPTRWRADGETGLRHYDDARYETAGQVAPAVIGALGQLAFVGKSTAFCVAGPLDVRAGGLVARAAKVEHELVSPEVAEVGDLGAAGPLLSLADVLGRIESGARGACVAVEPGAGAVAVTLEVRAPVPVQARRPRPVDVDYVGYLQRFGVLRGPEAPDPIVPWAATPGAARDDELGALVGGRCSACGALSIPVRPRCIECGSGDRTLERPARTGAVVTHNTQHVVAVDPEPAPVAVGVIRLEGEAGTRGGQVSAMFCDSPLDQLRVGAPVELVYRRLGSDAGLVKYGWKARLVDGPTADPGLGGAR